MKHIKLVKQVMEMLLNGEEEVLCILKKQYETAKIVSEKESTAGFFVNYQVDHTQMIPDDYNQTFQIGDVDGAVNGVDGAVGFILFIKNGYLTMLEGYTNSIDEWPKIDSQIKLKYDRKPRDYTSLRREWDSIKRSI